MLAAVVVSVVDPVVEDEDVDDTCTAAVVVKAAIEGVVSMGEHSTAPTPQLRWPLGHGRHTSALASY